MLHGLPIGIVSARAAAFLVSQSIRFNDDDSAYMTRTPSTAGNRKTWTFSVWVKGGYTAGTVLFNAGTSGNIFQLNIGAGSGQVQVLNQTSSSNDFVISYSPLLRDPSSWYHICLQVSTIEAVSTDRVKLWINGTQVTDTTSATWPSLNFDTWVNSTNGHYISSQLGASNYLNHLVALPILVDGAALDYTSFAEFNGIFYDPIDASGLTFGTNGFLLDFSDTPSRTTDTTAVGKSSHLALATNLTGSGTASASSTNASADAANAFNGTWSSGGYWYPTSTGGGSGTNWLKYDFGSATTVNAFRLDQQFQGYLDSIFLQSSTDDASWTTRYTITNGVVNGNSRFSSGRFSDVSARYWRILSNSGTVLGGGTFWTITELGLYNVTDGTDGVLGVEHFEHPGINANDQLSDTPTDSSTDGTGVFMTMSPINRNTNVTLSDGNLRVVASGGDKRTCISTHKMPSTGKFYIEVYWTTYAGDSGVGFIDENVMHTSSWRTDTNGLPGGTQNTDGYCANDGANYYVDGGGLVSLTAPSTGQYQQVAIDMDTGEVWYGINNTWLNSGDPAAGTGEVGTFDAANLTNGLFFHTSSRSSADCTINFGQQAFNYTPPTGFEAVGPVTAKESAPTIADPSLHFNTVLYTGDGTAIGSGGNAITGFGFQPDFVWIKNRDQADNHMLYDAVRGSTKDLHSNATDAEATDTEGLSTFDSDGFTVGSNVEVNTNTETYVAWGWKANGSGSSNTDGSITSTVSANTTAGFSIGTYEGNGSSGTVGHGLGATPDLILVKNRDNAGSTDADDGWAVLHTGIWDTTNYYTLLLQTTGAQSSTSGRFSSNGSSTFGVGGDFITNRNANTFLFYAWTEVEGFSKFGSYTGNGSTDGPFVYTGFKPAFIMTKRIDSTSNWQMQDFVRDGYNGANNNLAANNSNAEGATQLIDILSTGWKIKSTNTEVNASGGTYIYAAFAAEPFDHDGVAQVRAR